MQFDDAKSAKSSVLFVTRV